MKKLIILIGIILISYTGHSQVNDSIELMDNSILNEMPSDAEMFFWYIDGSDTIVRNIQGNYIQTFFRNGVSLKPRSNSFNLIVGAQNQGLSNIYKFYVKGKGYFDENLTLNNALNIRNSSIFESSGELWFSDPTNGVNSLSALISGSSVSVANGIATDDDVFVLGGLLDRETSIFQNGNTFYMYDGLNSMRIEPSSGTVSLTANTRMNLYSYGDMNIYTPSKFRLATYSGDTPLRWYDYTATPYGLCMPDWATYYSNITSDDKESALMTYGGMELYVAANGGGGGSGGVACSDCLALDTNYVKLFNDSDMDTFKIVPVIVDTITDDLYLATLDISSSNITSGDSLSLISAPGTNYAIIPIKAALYYDYGSATYASGATSYIRTGAYGDEQNIISIGTGVINQAEDRLTLSSEDAAASASLALIVAPNSEREVNQPYWLQIGSGFTTGNGTFKLKLWYTIANFN